MDAELFTPQAPGHLLPTEGGDIAFSPHPLPARFSLGREEMILYANAAGALGELRGLTTQGLLPNSSLLLRPLQREESLRSSSLEGTYASAEDLLLFELAAPDADNSGPRREVHNYDLALRQGEEWIKTRGLNDWLVRSLHQQLLRGVRGEDKSPGEYRTGQVQIGTQARFVPPPGRLIPECMDALLSYCQAPNDDLPPLVRTFVVHYQFETIHPFRDGNGRVGRLLLSLMIARWCGLDRPWLYLSDFFERHRGEYIDGLFNVSARGDWSRWIRFCLHGTIEQSQETIRKCRSLLTLRNRWLDIVRTNSVHPRTLAIIDHLLGTPIVDIAHACDILDVRSQHTARKDLEQLVTLGVLKIIRESHPRTYLAPAVMEIAHKGGAA